jgi:hypothetical protein
LIAKVIIIPCYLEVFGMASLELTYEYPEPNKSKNNTFANCVIRFGLSIKPRLLFKNLGPIPARLIYCADRPGAPTAINNGNELRLSGEVCPSTP